MSRPGFDGDGYGSPGGSPGASPSGSRRSGNGNGGGGASDHRLAELERRVNNLEGKIEKVNDLCIEIRTRLENVATNAFVWKIFAGILGISVASFIGHIILRFIPS